MKRPHNLLTGYWSDMIHFLRGAEKNESTRGFYNMLYTAAISSLPKDDDLRKTDHGLIIGGGLKFKRFEVGLVWDIGLVNIAPDSDDGLSAKNRLFRVDIVILAL